MNLAESFSDSLRITAILNYDDHADSNGTVHQISEVPKMSEKEPIVTASGFREVILSLISRQEPVYKGSLEDFLRALLVSLAKYESKSPSYSLFALILEEAFQDNPRTFNDDWLQYTEPPPNRVGQDILQAKSKAYGFHLPIAETTAKGLSDFECLHRTTLFQIAELRRFAEKKPEEYGKYAEYAMNYKYLGLESPTGQTWYNWDPFTYLECATAGLVANSKWTGPEFKQGISWAVFAYVLECGRNYE